MRIALLLILYFFINLNSFTSENYYVSTPPFKSLAVENYDIDTAKKGLSEIDIQPLEGIWYYPDEMLTLAIERFSATSFSENFKYRIVLIESNDISLKAGTIIGYIMDSAQRDKFYLWIYSEKRGQSLYHPQKCVASIKDLNSVITFEKPEIKFKFRFNFARFLPTLFKGLSITMERKEEKLPLGFKKIFPSYDDDGSVIDKIRYL